MSLTIVYVLSCIITGAGAIWYLFKILEEDRERVERGYRAKLTWLNILGGVIGVFIPIFNTVIACAIIAHLLDRPIIGKRK